MSVRIGIDIGGTFTDLVALDESGTLVRWKVASTPGAPERGFLAALDALLETCPASDVARIAHASTIATNALLGQVNLPLPRVAFVTTAGFRDILEIGRQQRSAIYDLGVERPTPLAARVDRLTVRERRTHTGETLVPLDAGDVERVVATVVERRIRSVAIGLLHADVDGAHERAIAAALRAAIAGIDVSLSSEIDPQHREYERFSTTVVNAALRPIVRAYLDAIATGVRARGIAASVDVMRSDGGITSLAFASERPASLIESGPASGVLAAAYLAKAMGLARVLSFDMGGTTAKAGAILGGAPEIATSFEAAGRTHSGRAQRGSGYPVRFPFVDLAEVSAGGGTLAWLDAAGRLRVGPLSAGADPGPACYGTGCEPTVTDANVVLGRSSAVALLGGTFAIDPVRAHAAIARVAVGAGGATLAAAVGIVRLVDAEMAKVLRIVSVERGHDPRDFTLLAFGGGGPLHACAVGDDIGVARIVVPLHAGVFSAYGLLVADVRAVAMRSLVASADRATWVRACALFETLVRETGAELAAQAIAPHDRTFAREVAMRYVGQSSELTVAVAPTLAEVIAAFHDRHERRFGYAVRDEAVEFVAVRVVAIGTTRKPPTRPDVRLAEGSSSRQSRTREVWDGSALVTTPVFARDELAIGATFAGPVVVEQYDATTYVARDWHATVDAFANLVLERPR